MNMNIAGDKDLFNFLANAPKEFREGEKIKKYQLKNGDYIHCVLWNMHFYITGTDIVKILVWRFNNAGRQITSPKKFEEGVFSDLRNLKPGIDATLERPRSEFLEFLYKNGCIRTQKKQKVFFWYSVPHDALFCDALDRDLRRETSYYSYSKYMNTFAPVGMMEQIEFNHHDNAPYTPPPGAALKKKNSVKMAARNKRSPKDSLIRPEYKMQKPNHDLLNTCMPLDMPDSMCDYTGYNNTGLDPFIPFGAQGSYNFNYSDIGFADEMNINNIEFGQFSSPPTKIETEKTYGMPEIFNTQKDDQTDDTAGYMNSNRNYVQNIPNTQVIKSKRSSTAQAGAMGFDNDDQNNVAHNTHPFLRVYNPNRARPSDEPVVVCLQHFIEGINDLLIEIQRYEREAESYFNTNQRDNKFLQEYLRNIESVKNNTGSDPESIKNKQTHLTCLSEQVQCLEEKMKVSEAGYKESQSLIKSKIEEMSLDIKEAQERFPEEYQDGFKHFEENPHYMAALQFIPVLNED